MTMIDWRALTGKHEDHDWTLYQYITPKTLTDGSRSGWCAMLMCRTVGGKAQYRQPTAREKSDYHMELW
jgi:hypothetical protein